MFGGREKRRLRIRNNENENPVVASICDFSAQNVSSENTSNLKSTSKQKRALGRKLVVINGGKSWAVWPFLIRKTLAPFFLSPLTR